MKPRLIVVFLLIVLLPLGLLSWLGYRLARNEREVFRSRMTDLLLVSLNERKTGISAYITQVQNDLLHSLDGLDLNPELLREYTRRESRVAQTFLLDATGEPVVPSYTETINRAERDFLVRTERIWRDHDLLRQANQARFSSDRLSHVSIPSQSVQQQAPVQQVGQQLQQEQQQQRQPQQVPQQVQPRQQVDSGPIQPMQGWYSWYWDKGLHLLLWRNDLEGRILGVEVDRARLLADLIGQLPTTGERDSRVPLMRTMLTESGGTILYQWGNYTPPQGAQPAVALPLDPPLASWRLECFIPAETLQGSGLNGAVLNLLMSLAGAGLALLGLATYFYRESSREMREAAQRVTFVNQVSHELKTPLTNIRMYAEILDEDLPEEETRARGHLGIILDESRRLSRLIGNILTFSRKQRSKLAIHTAPGVVDEIISNVVAHFEPSLNAKGVAVLTELNAKATVQVDRDVLEQIIGNLINNVEKYASDGGVLRITSSQDRDETWIEVSDHGPGIPWSERERIFEPFHRLSNRLSDGVTGTGIGLSISRDLARLHGGDLFLKKGGEGAAFLLTLRTSPIEEASEA